MRSTLRTCLLLTILSCGGSDGPTDPYNDGNNNKNTGPPDTGQSVEIGVLDNYYQPQERTVTAGTTVRWEWAVGGYSSHTVTLDDGSGSSEALNVGSYSRVFDAPGTYTYHCDVHGAAVMSGTIIVQPKS